MFHLWTCCWNGQGVTWVFLFAVFLFHKNALWFWYIHLHLAWSSFPLVKPTLPEGLILSVSAQSWAFSSFLTKGNWSSKRWRNLPKAPQPEVTKYRFKLQWAWLPGPEGIHLKSRVDNIWLLLIMPLHSALICHSVYSIKLSIHVNPTKFRGLSSCHFASMQRISFQMSPERWQIWVGVWSVSIYRPP